jgi:ribonucleoside-diphosphate reductase alpha chain
MALFSVWSERDDLRPRQQLRVRDQQADAAEEEGPMNPAQHPTASPQTATGKALSIERFFTSPDTHPFDAIKWERRDARIGHGDRVAFEQADVEFPKSWSQNATNIVAQKYFRGQLGSPDRESSVKEMISRVAGTISRWGREGNYFASEEDARAFNHELTHILVNQMAAFNSPVWFNVGFEESPQCSACLPYHALVSTPQGMVPIGEIVESEQVGLTVYDSTGVTKVVAVKDNGRKPVWRVKLRNGSFIEATPDHVVKAVSEPRGMAQWLRVDQLRLGMRMHLHPHGAIVQQPAFVGAAEASSGIEDLEIPVSTEPIKLEIASIEPLGEMNVYDIQTESNEFLTNNVAVHNCFILSVEDTMESILAWNTKEGMIFRGGSGSGINLSNIRGSMEPLAKGGTASGPVSFMRGADSWAGTIKSGGKTRRAAKMVVLDVDHPDIREFIWCKAKEEDKAEALRDAGFDMSIDGDGFKSIQYQNANNSVRVTDEFMRAVEEDGEWRLIARSTGKPVGKPVSARELMSEIAEAAYRCADPGMQYDTTINRWHTSPNSGRINASNPCSEYMHVDNSACNLASLNLMKFRRSDGTFDVASFEHAVDIVLLAQEIVVGPSSYPTEQIGVNARAFRQLGLGYTNLGAYLMSNGMPYDSDEGRNAAAAITALMTGRAYLRSAQVAGALGPYERYAENREAHNNVMRMHRDAAYAVPEEGSADTALLEAGRRAWDEAVEQGEIDGYRNAQASVLAPTGTISFLLDADTTGVEPDFSLVKFKELVGGGQMTIVNKTVPLALQTLGYSEQQIEQIEAHIAEHGTIVGAPGLNEEHLPVFDVAVGERAISHMGHIKMMGAVQPFISGAISKTVNLPQEATVEDIADAYLQAWHLGIKALAIYRDGSKTAQALRTDAQKAAPADVDAIVEQAVSKALAEAGPQRKRMPRERQSITHKFSIGGHEGYITAGMYPDGSVGEIFLTDIGKEGSTLRGMMNSFATAISIALQYGVPLETLVQKFSYMRFEPEGITGNTEIPFAKSMPDYIMRWLASRFLDTDAQEELGILTPAVRARKAAQEVQQSMQGSDTAGPSAAGESSQSQAPEASAEAVGESTPAAASLTDSPPVVPARLQGLDLGPACSQCGGMMQRTGSCYTCSSCGNNTGCG